MYLSSNIKYLRKTHKMTQQSLADNIGVNRANVTAYELGKSIAPLEVIQEIKQLFGISIDDLVEIDLSNRVTFENDKSDLKLQNSNKYQQPAKPKSYENLETETITQQLKEPKSGYKNPTSLNDLVYILNRIEEKEAAIVLDTDGSILYSNNVFCGGTGKTKRQLFRVNINEVFSPDGDTATSQRFNYAIEQKAKFKGKFKDASLEMFPFDDGFVVFVNFTKQ